MWDRLGRVFDGGNKADRDALYGLLGAKAKPYWQPLAKCFECAGDHLAEDAIGEIVEDFCDLFYEDHLRREWEAADAESRLEDVKEVGVQIAGAEAAKNDGGEAGASLGRLRLETFLADVALLTNLDAKKNNLEQDQVTLSTVHQAKGMEWPVVFVPWLSEGMFPSSKAAEEGRADEERRLFYVVVTRAKDRLFLFTPTMRKTADGGMFPVDPSVFVKEIPEDLLTVRRVSFTPETYGGYGQRSYGSYSGGRYGSYTNRRRW